MSYLEQQILHEVLTFNGKEKAELLDYVKGLKYPRHNTKLHRKKALNQIRNAIKNQF